MSKRFGVYKCSICGNIAEVLHNEKPDIHCCNKPMILLEENSVDASKEKHVPIVEKTNGGCIVKIGSVDHPMEEKHYIEWIEINASPDVILRKFLKPGDPPYAEFFFDINEKPFTAKAYCNLHGMWKAS